MDTLNRINGIQAPTMSRETEEKLRSMFKEIQIPFMIWNNISLIRISIQVYNTKEDVYKLLEALKKEFC